MQRAVLPTMLLPSTAMLRCFFDDLTMLMDTSLLLLVSVVALRLVSGGDVSGMDAEDEVDEGTLPVD